MKITIETAQNGFIISENDIQEDGTIIPITTVIETDDLKEVHSWRKLLYEITERFGMFGSRYDEERLYIIIRPGDKNDKFTEKDADVIWAEQPADSE